MDVLHKNMRFANPPIFGIPRSHNITMAITADRVPDWEIFHPSPPSLEFQRQRLLGLVTASDILLKLGNTGSAAYCRNVGNDLVRSLPSHIDQFSLRREILPIESTQAVMEYRHPDPSIYRSLEITNPELQVRGSWQRLKWADSSKLSSRMAHACFIYKSGPSQHTERGLY